MEWISVNDRLPEFGTEVLCFAYREEYNVYNVDSLQQVVHNEHGVSVEFWHTSDVSYWMPLCEPPKTE